MQEKKPGSHNQLVTDVLSQQLTYGLDKLVDLSFVKILIRHFPYSAVFVFDLNLRYILVGGMEPQSFLPGAGSAWEGKTIWEVLPEKELPKVEYDYRATLAGEQTVTEIVNNDKTFRVQILPIQDDTGVTIAGMMTVEEVQPHPVTFPQSLLHDELTGLPNRAILINRLETALARKKYQSDYQIAVLFLDLDRFKVINDTLGHAGGDRLLIITAQRLKNCLRNGDTLVRLGADEFVILLEDFHTIDDVIRISQRIQLVLREPIDISGREVITTASLGIAIAETENDYPEDLLRNADIAMDQAKLMGKGNYQFFHNTMYSHAVQRLQLENDLRHALEAKQFYIVYQPIVSLNHAKIIGFEALLRWQHPEKNNISPTDFIPIAEETGLIVPIGYWVLQTACQQMQRWQTTILNAKNLVLSVNLSGRQLTQTDLVEHIKVILRQTGLPPQTLKLEITESVLMENAVTAIHLLRQLKEIGVLLAIDDFGTGYSSLSYLHQFPIDTLKIDRSFIEGLDNDAEQVVIVRTICNLAWNLGMDVVAEGVETGKQLSQAKALNCDSAQGYHFYKPLTAEMAEQLLRDHADWI